MEITYVIPTCGASTLNKTIETILNQNLRPFKIVIIENGVIVEKKIKNVQYINLKKNFGYAKGCNLGIVHSETPFVALINDDVFLPQNWSEEILKEFQKDNLLGACTSFIKSEDGSVQVGSVEFNNYFEAVEVPYFKEGNLLNFTAVIFSKISIDKTGLLDESFFSYYEDVDYSLRLIKNGFKIKSIENLFAIHKGGLSKNFLNKKKEFYLFRNKNLTILKNFGFNFYLKNFPKIFRGDLKILKNNPHFIFYYPLFFLKI